MKKKTITENRIWNNTHRWWEGGGLIPDPHEKKKTVPELPMKTIAVPELLTKNITVLELPMKKFLIQIPEQINVSRIPILHNPEFTIVDIGGVVDHH
jgi:hypothetical protein